MQPKYKTWTFSGGAFWFCALGLFIASVLGQRLAQDFTPSDFERMGPDAGPKPPLGSLERDRLVAEELRKSFGYGGGEFQFDGRPRLPSGDFAGSPNKNWEQVVVLERRVLERSGSDPKSGELALRVRRELDDGERFYRVALAPTPEGGQPPSDDWRWDAMAQLSRLRMVSAAGRAVGDDQMRRIMKHRGIRFLDLADTRVSAAMVERLVMGLPNLRRLVIDDGVMTEAERNRMHARRPGLTLYVTPAGAVERTPWKSGLNQSEWLRRPPPTWLCRELTDDGGFTYHDFDGTTWLTWSRAYEGLDEGHLRAMVRWPDVVCVDWFNSAAADEHVRMLTSGPATIVYLGIARTQVTPAAASTLRRLTQLRVLHVDDKFLVPETIEILRELKHLRWVTIDCEQFPSAAAERTAKALPGVAIRLRSASPEWAEFTGGVTDGPAWTRELQGELITGQGVANPLWAFRSLREVEIELPDTKQIDSLPYLPETKRLRFLGRGRNFGTIDQALLERIGRCEQLEYLLLDDEVTATNFAPLERLRRLADLSVNCRSLSADEAARLCASAAKLPQLTTLTLLDAELTYPALERFKTAPNLRRLQIYPKAETRFSAKILLSRLPQLTHLRLYGQEFTRD